MTLVYKFLLALAGWLAVVAVWAWHVGILP